MRKLTQKFTHIRGNAGSAITPSTPVARSSTTGEITPSSATARQNLDSDLESLPPKIRRYLLSVLELADLKALVRASPALHEQYLLDRSFLLCSGLEVTLGSAVYRFQLLCQVTDPTSPALGLEHITSNATAVFLAPEPWEIEELICVYAFAQSVCEKVFDDIKTQVHPNNPRFDDQDRPHTPDGAFEFDNPCK